jgi:hypothetical protein
VHLLAGDARTGSAQAGRFYAPTDSLRTLADRLEPPYGAVVDYRSSRSLFIKIAQ